MIKAVNNEDYVKLVKLIYSKNTEILDEFQIQDGRATGTIIHDNLVKNLVFPTNIKELLEKLIKKTLAQASATFNDQYVERYGIGFESHYRLFLIKDTELYSVLQNSEYLEILTKHYIDSLSPNPNDDGLLILSPYWSKLTEKTLNTDNLNIIKSLAKLTKPATITQKETIFGVNVPTELTKEEVTGIVFRPIIIGIKEAPLSFSYPPKKEVYAKVSLCPVKVITKEVKLGIEYYQYNNDPIIKTNLYLKSNPEAKASIKTLGKVKRIPAYKLIKLGEVNND